MSAAHPCLPVLLLFLVLPAGAAELHRWVDSAGRVHYGDTVPGPYRERSQPIDLKRDQVADAARREQQQRLAREQHTLATLQSERRRLEALRAAAPRPEAPASPRPANTCEAQWRQYEASLACFHPYRNVNGSVKPEAFQRCREVMMPSCPRRGR